MLVLDGVYTFDNKRPRFHRVKAPNHDELWSLLHTIASRVTRALEKQGLLIRDAEQPYLDLEPADGFEGQAYLQLLGSAGWPPASTTASPLALMPAIRHSPYERCRPQPLATNPIPLMKPASPSMPALSARNTKEKNSNTHAAMSPARIQRAPLHQ